MRRQLHASLSQTASDIIMCARRPGTKKQYKTYLKKWKNYCNSKGIRPVSASITKCINLSAEPEESGIGYSAVNTARSALSTILVVNDTFSFDMHPLVKKFLKGVFEQKPSLPRYEVIWDVNQVLNRLRSYPPIECISLKELTLKVVMLLALSTGERTQTIHCLDVNHMTITDKTYIFYLTSLQKQSQPGKHPKPIELKAFDQEHSLRIIHHLGPYIEKTGAHRNDITTSQSLLNYQKPFKPVVSKDTISRWVKIVLEDAGIDITKFPACSTRASLY